MSRSYQIPGGPYVTETGSRSYQIPGGPYVNETVASGVTGTLRTALGIARANIKSINGIAIASVKTFDGLTP